MTDFSVAYLPEEDPMKVDLFYDEAERATKFRTLEDETLQFLRKVLHSESRIRL